MMKTMRERFVFLLLIGGVIALYSMTQVMFWSEAQFSPSSVSSLSSSASSLSSSVSSLSSSASSLSSSASALSSSASSLSSSASSLSSSASSLSSSVSSSVKTSVKTSASSLSSSNSSSVKSSVKSSPPSTSQSLSKSSPTSNKSIAVIFTTFSDKPSKFKFYLSTIKNWAAFLPDIQPVLFSTNASSPLTRLAKKHGWLVTHFTGVNEFGVPFLKAMYHQALSITALQNAKLVGFSNGDILFARDLIPTLQKISDEIPYKTATMAIGRRFRYEGNCSGETFDIWSPEQVLNLVRDDKLPIDPAYSVDIYFMSRDYPWDAIKNIVIARRGWDNYLVARSIQISITTIDISETVTALHECGHIKDRHLNMTVENLDYNMHLIGYYPYSIGRTRYAKLMTRYDENGEVIITKHSKEAQTIRELTKNHPVFQRQMNFTENGDPVYPE